MPLKINVGGVWKDAIPWVKVGGVWKELDVGWVFVGEDSPRIYYEKKKAPFSFTSMTEGVNQTYIIPPGRYTGLRVRVQGAGGGGGGPSGSLGGSGGGGGAAAEKTFVLTPADVGKTITYSVGRHGNASGENEAGGWGLNSVVRAVSPIGGYTWTVTAGGGGPGYPGNGAAGPGGTASMTGGTLDASNPGGDGTVGVGATGGAAGLAGHRALGWFGTSPVGDGGQGHNSPITAANAGVVGYVELYFFN